jgi:zinc/manganese transport system ATP-binding protein
VSRSSTEADCAALAFTDVSAVRGRRLIWSEATFEVPAGGIVALIGANGAGKTTLLHMILGLVPVASGEVRVFGEEPGADNDGIGFVPQDYAATAGEAIRARDLVMLGLTGRRWAFGRATSAQRQKVRETLAAVDATDFADQRLAQLSGGQRQRIAIARVILKNAPVLILDEATSALDSITERAIQQTLDGVMKGKTVIVVAHRLSTVSHLDRILVFEHGAIVEDGSHTELLNRHGAYHRLWDRQAGGFLPERADAERQLAS